MDDIIRLNVGGTVYATTISTVRDRLSLVQMPSNGHSSSPPEFFIDRDGALFRHILRYLRDGRLSLPEDFNEMDALMVEAESYQIPGLVDDLNRWFQNLTESRTMKIHLLEFVQNDLVPFEMVQSPLAPGDYKGPFFDWTLTAPGDPGSILWMTNVGAFSGGTPEVTTSEDGTTLYRSWYTGIQAGQTEVGYMYGFAHPRSPICKDAVFAQIKDLGYTLIRVSPLTGPQNIDPLLRPFVTVQSAKTFEFVSST